MRAFVHKRTVQPRQHGEGNPSDLTQDDLQLIKTWKKARPTSSLRESHDFLNELSGVFEWWLFITWKNCI